MEACNPPHLDPELQFDIGRARIEDLIDDALASEDPVQMRDPRRGTEAAEEQPRQVGTNINPTKRSQISHVVYDSTWEKLVADVCEHDDRVRAWAKNDHLGFKIRYLWNGSSRNYVPDYLIRLGNGITLVLEVKGQDSEQNRGKRAALARWISAVNAEGGFGQWCSDVIFEPAQIRDVLATLPLRNQRGLNRIVLRGEPFPSGPRLALSGQRGDIDMMTFSRCR